MGLGWDERCTPRPYCNVDAGQRNSLRWAGGHIVGPARWAARLAMSKSGRWLPSGNSGDELVIEPVARNVEEQLRRIGYGDDGAKRADSRDYTKQLQECGFSTLAQLQFITLEGLHQCKIKPGHAAEIFHRLKAALGTPPVQVAGKPVPVYLFVTSPPQMRDVDANRRTCDMRFVFSAVWCDPRLKQEKNVAVQPGDPVVAPWCWRPQFVASGSPMT